MIVLVNPNVVVQRSDLLTTGIPYWPIGLAYLAAQLRDKGYEVRVVDAFGEAPRRYRRTPRFLIRGLSPAEVSERVLEGGAPAAVLVYAGVIGSHMATMEIVRALHRAAAAVPVIVFENTQAVYAYSLRRIAAEFKRAGAAYVLTGEPELSALRLLETLRRGDKPEAPDGVIARGETPDLDSLPFPAWDLLPLENYWAMGYAHGPVGGRFLPILTSRGCPYACRFCVSPETTRRRWRGRGAKNVVEEMERHGELFGVREFHLEDLNPTVQEKRVREMCEELLRRKLKLNWKIAAGTKIETITRLDTLDLMARAGCRYLSFSPETGSPRLLKLINKPFRWDFALEQVARMDSIGIRTQACFVLGFPGETDEDRRRTWEYIRKLVRAGLDEIALFIIAPIAGAAIFDRFPPPGNLSRVTFSPSWREDYKVLSRFRLKLYAAFLLWKTMDNPGKIIRQALCFLLRRFETKMEMTPYRALREKLESLFAAQR